jgi:hypothetical protein
MKILQLLCSRRYCPANIQQLNALKPTQPKSKSKLCYDRRSVGQSVLVSSTHLELTTRFLLLLNSCVFVDEELFLWRENGSAVYNCCWSSPGQSFSGQSPAGLVTIFYPLRFETPPTLEGQALSSPFVASYDSQGYGGGIVTRLHARYSLTHFYYLSRSRSRRLLPAASRHAHTWHRALLGPMAIYLFNFKTYVFFLSLNLLIDKGGVGLLYIYIGVHLLHLTPPEVTFPLPGF